MVNVKKSILARIFRREEVADGGSAEWDRNPATRRSAPRGGSVAGNVRRPVTEVDEQVIEAPRAKAASPPKAASAPPSPAPSVDPAIAQRVAEAGQVLATTMGKQEELNLALKHGFDGINTMLDGLDRKIDKQQKSSDEIMISVRKLPEIMKDAGGSSQAGVELLGRISTVLENQGRATQELLTRISEIPRAMESLQTHLAEQSAELAKAHKNVDRTMHETQRQLSNAFSEVQRTVGQAASEQGRRQDHLLTEIRTQQARQDQRVEELVNRSNGAMRLVVFLLVLSIAALLLVVNQMNR